MVGDGGIRGWAGTGWWVCPEVGHLWRGDGRMKCCSRKGMLCV